VFRLDTATAALARRGVFSPVAGALTTLPDKEPYREELNAKAQANSLQSVRGLTLSKFYFCANGTVSLKCKK
jgi:hypothetical protein